MRGKKIQNQKTNRNLKDQNSKLFKAIAQNESEKRKKKLNEIEKETDL